MPIPRHFLPLSASASALPWSWRRGLAAVPFVTVFLASAWIVFLLLVKGDGKISGAIQPSLGFVISLWDHDVGQAILRGHLGLLVQHSWPQMLYVTLLMLLGGVAYERRYGSLRTGLVFYMASLAGVSLLVLVVLLAPTPGFGGLSEHVHNTSFSGASVGCFGILGALAATARNPWPMVAAVACYETFLETLVVPDLAVAMHMVGFSVGFAASRLAIAEPFSTRPSADASAPPLSLEADLP